MPLKITKKLQREATKRLLESLPEANEVRLAAVAYADQRTALANERLLSASVNYTNAIRTLARNLPGLKP